MAKTCLLQSEINKFREALRTGKIDIARMSQMTTESRRDYLAGFVGQENAKFVNTLFESKLLLKNQQMGMITWAKKVAALSPEARRDVITRIEKLDKALNPATEDAFLGDIVEQRLGIKIDLSGAKKITELTGEMSRLWEEAKSKLEGKPPTNENIKAILRQGDKKYFKTYKKLLDFISEQRPVYFNNKFTEFSSKFIEGISVARAIKTGLDLSASLRQGAAYFGRKEWNNAFIRMFGYLKSQTAVDALEIEMMSNKYTDYAMKFKRDLGLTLLGETMTQREEVYMSKFTEKIPLLRGSERAYTGFLNDLRFNRFVNILESLDNAGQSITDNEEAMRGLAQTIANASGRGQLGKLEPGARALATALFSPRWVASRIRLATDPFTKTGVARIEAIKNLATVSGISVSVLGMLALAGLDVEKDPRSSDFGKVKIGNIRFDFTAGMAPYIRLLAQIATASTKSSVTGKITKLNTGEYYSRTTFDVLLQFIENKASPMFGVFRDLLKGEQFGGEELGFDIDNPRKNIEALKYIANQMFTPLIISQSIESYNESSGNSLLTAGTIAAEMFGVGVNAYSYIPGGKDWDNLKEQYGDDEYAKAIKELNINMAPRLKNAQESDKFLTLSADEQNAVLDRIIYEEKEEIIKKYKLKENKKEKEKTISGKKLLRQIE